MGTKELRHNKRDGAECCRTAHSALWSDLASFNVLHLWETKGGPTAWVKCVTDLDICSLLLLALDVRKLWCLNKIQVPTDQAMRWLEGICVSCKSERVLLTYSFLVQLLMAFLDSWNFIRNPGCPLGISRSPGHSLSGQVPRSLRLFTSHLLGPPVILLNPKQLLSPPVKFLIFKSPGHLAGLLSWYLPPPRCSSPPVMPLTIGQTVKSPGHTCSNAVT